MSQLLGCVHANESALCFSASPKDALKSHMHNQGKERRGKEREGKERKGLHSCTCLRGQLS
eukprot:822040-Pelagomonas_calceolata.AAC.1